MSFTASPILAISPIVLPSPNRPVALEVKVTAPVQGDNLPIILLSHGGGQSNFLSSYRGYTPLVDYWASQGFVVIQPTHLSSKSLNLPPTTEGFPIFARSRVADMQQIIDEINTLIPAVPTLQGRVNTKKIAVVGHSGGGLTAGMLLGATYIDDAGNEVITKDERISTGILLATIGEGNADMPAPWGQIDIIRSFNYAKMTAPALVIAGDNYISPLSDRGALYHCDAYYYSPAPKTLLTLKEGDHMLGGVTGYDAEETTDENPQMVALIQQITTDYLHSQLNNDSTVWKKAVADFQQHNPSLGDIISKSNL